MVGAESRVVAVPVRTAIQMLAGTGAAIWGQPDVGGCLAAALLEQCSCHQGAPRMSRRQARQEHGRLLTPRCLPRRKQCSVARTRRAQLCGRRTRGVTRVWVSRQSADNHLARRPPAGRTPGREGRGWTDRVVRPDVRRHQDAWPHSRWAGPTRSPTRPGGGRGAAVRRGVRVADVPDAVRGPIRRPGLGRRDRAGSGPVGRPAQGPALARVGPPGVRAGPARR